MKSEPRKQTEAKNRQGHRDGRLQTKKGTLEAVVMVMYHSWPSESRPWEQKYDPVAALTTLTATENWQGHREGRVQKEKNTLDAVVMVKNCPCPDESDSWAHNEYPGVALRTKKRLHPRVGRHQQKRKTVAVVQAGKTKFPPANEVSMARWSRRDETGEKPDRQARNDAGH